MTDSLLTRLPPPLTRRNQPINAFPTVVGYVRMPDGSRLPVELDISQIRQNWQAQFEINLLLQGQLSSVLAPSAIPGYDATVNQILINNSGTLEWQTTVAVTPITHWQYDTTTHKWQIKTYTLTALVSGSESSWTDNPDGNQPVHALKVITDVEYDTTTHYLTQDYEDCYVLEQSSITVDQHIDDATSCT